MKRIVVIVFIFFLGVTASFVARKAETPVETLGSIIVSCWKENPNERYIRCVRGERLATLISAVGTKEVMESLASLYDGEKRVGILGTISCHDIAHLVGELTVERRSIPLSEAIVSCGAGCGYGCAHGAVLASFQRDRNLMGNVRMICESLGNEQYPRGSKSACEHGVGHGLADYNNLDTTKALKFCDGLTHEQDRFQCGRGVLMEVIDSPVLSHPRKSLPDDIVSYCSSFPGIYASSCFVNVGSRTLAASGDAKKALEACRNAPDALFNPCANYVGQNAYFLKSARPDRIFSVCRAFGDLWNACDAGVVESLASYGRTEPLTRYCGLFDIKEMQLCYQTYGEKTEYFLGSETRKKECSGLPEENRRACAGQTDI